MPRPLCKRYINYCPPVDVFTPADNANTECINLTLDEFEAIRLSDYEGLYHDEASRMMNISRPTFTRLIEQARRKVATAIVEGKGIQIKGGPVDFRCQRGESHPHGFCHRRRWCRFQSTDNFNNKAQTLITERRDDL